MSKMTKEQAAKAAEAKMTAAKAAAAAARSSAAAKAAPKDDPNVLSNSEVAAVIALDREQEILDLKRGNLWLRFCGRRGLDPDRHQFGPGNRIVPIAAAPPSNQ